LHIDKEVIKKALSVYTLRRSMNEEVLYVADDDSVAVQRQGGRLVVEFPRAKFDEPSRDSAAPGPNEGKTG